MMRLFMLWSLCVALLGWPMLAEAQSRAVSLAQGGLDPRGEPELVICSQNLENYGTLEQLRRRRPSASEQALREKERRLATRFATAGCDVVAVQELLGSTLPAAREGLQRLAQALQRVTNRFFEARVGESNDNLLHNGYLVAKDRAEIVNAVSYVDVELPKISDKQRPRKFSRGPYELQLAVRPRGEGPVKTVTLVNFHFKSRRGNPGDPAGLQWETYRMEMSEGLRRIVESRHARSFVSGETLLVVLGDRNSNYGTASAGILEGRLNLDAFRGSAPCRLSKMGAPLCQQSAVAPQRLFSVLRNDPEASRQPGTFSYRGAHLWLDDILLPAETLPYARSHAFEEGNYEAAVLYTPRQASDHALISVTLNW